MEFYGNTPILVRGKTQSDQNQRNSASHILANAGVTDTGTNPKERLVAELLADSRYGSQEERAREFVAGGAGCRRTYFNYARKLREGR